MDGFFARGSLTTRAASGHAVGAAYVTEFDADTPAARPRGGVSDPTRLGAPMSTTRRHRVQARMSGGDVWLVSARRPALVPPSVGQGLIARPVTRSDTAHRVRMAAELPRRRTGFWTAGPRIVNLGP